MHSEIPPKTNIPLVFWAIRFSLRSRHPVLLKKKKKKYECPITVYLFEMLQSMFQSQNGKNHQSYCVNSASLPPFVILAILGWYVGISGFRMLGKSSNWCGNTGIKRLWLKLSTVGNVVHGQLSHGSSIDHNSNAIPHLSNSWLETRKRSILYFCITFRRVAENICFEGRKRPDVMRVTQEECPIVTASEIENRNTVPVAIRAHTSLKCLRNTDN